MSSPLRAFDMRHAVSYSPTMEFERSALRRHGNVDGAPPSLSLTACLMALVSSLALGQAGARDGCTGVVSYFPAVPGMSWTYHRLAPTLTGSIEERYIECTETTHLDGERTILLKQVYYVGSAKTTTLILYSVSTSGDKLYMTASANDLTGVRAQTGREVVIKMPPSDGTSRWSYEECNENGSVTGVHERSASVVAQCSTAAAVFVDVLRVVSEYYETAGPWAEPAEHLGLVSRGFSKRTSGRELLWREERFYARGVGLVKTLYFDAQGQLGGMASGQLVTNRKPSR